MSFVNNDFEASYSSRNETSVINEAAAITGAAARKQSMQENVLHISTSSGSSKKGTSNLETLMHIIKANIGTGVLAMPLAFKNGGLLLSSISIWIMAVICVHCMHILLDSYKYVTDNMLKEADNTPIHSFSYDEVVEYSLQLKFTFKPKLAKYARLFIIVFLIFSQLGFCCVYYVFIPKNIQQVVEFYHPDNTVSVEIYMCILLLPTILFCLIKNLKILAPFSALANILMISGMFVIMYELITGTQAPTTDIVYVAPFRNWAIFYSSAIYAFEGINLVLPVYQEMTQKEQFHPWNGVLNTGMALVAIMYFTIGFFGYLKYGNNAAASITLNLPAEQVSFQILKILFAIAIFISYNLQFYVAANVLWSALCRSSKFLQRYIDNINSGVTSYKRKLSIIENIFRSLLVTFTFSMAILVPRIDLFISLVGAVSGSVLALIIPPLLDIMLFLPSSKYFKIKLAKNILILLFGFYIFFTGTYFSLEDIITYFRTGK